MKHTKRIQAVKNILAKENFGAVLVSSPANIFYLSGFLGLSPLEREAYCFITKKNAYFITSALYAGGIKDNGMNLEIVSGKNPITKILQTIVEKENITRIGFEDTNITVLEHEKFSNVKSKWTPTDIYDIRTFKDEEEIEKVLKACAIGDKIFDYILKKIEIGMTEKQLASLMEICMLQNEVVSSFPTIVAFGKNAAIPHHQTGQDTLRENQFILLDFGVFYKGYCSDMTRTVFIGKPTDRDKKIYDAVLKAQINVINFINSNHKKHLSASEADKVARDSLQHNGFEGFPHSLGHGIGIEVHESPSLSPFSKDVLSEGMVFSIEPGIYLNNDTGVRIEDLFTLQEGKLIQLTNSPKELIVL